ncbi:MAG: hypothetical protein AB7U75_14770 [Hyphomicrobiaceae bacterium]
MSALDLLLRQVPEVVSQKSAMWTVIQAPRLIDGTGQSEEKAVEDFCANNGIELPKGFGFVAFTCQLNLSGYSMNAEEGAYYIADRIAEIRRLYPELELEVREVELHDADGYIINTWTE